MRSTKREKDGVRNSGLVVGTMLNRTNRGMIAVAVDALELKPGATAADLGFGGGAGLAMLLEKVGPQAACLALTSRPRW